MTFIRLDDRFLMGKARAWGVKGRSLYLAGLCYCNRELTDGQIPKNMVAVLLVEAEVDKGSVRLLVAAGVWIDEGDHYRVHDYLDHQRSRAQAMRERAKWRRQKQAQAAAGEADSTGGSDEVPRVDYTGGSARGSTPTSTPTSAPLPPRPEVEGERWHGVTSLEPVNGSGSAALQFQQKQKEQKAV